MATQNTATDPLASIYRSGVAARLAGIPVETLRVWERRYNIVGPTVSASGQRLYSAEQIKRLALIKQLVDMGHPIGAVAVLPDDALIAMRSATGFLSAKSVRLEDAAKKMRIVLVGPLLCTRRIEETLAQSALQITGRCLNIGQAGRELQNTQADIAVIEFPLLNDTSLETITSVLNACSARQAIILYRFAPSAVIKRLRAAGHEVARAPSDAIEIESLCLSLLRLPPSRTLSMARNGAEIEIPPRRFDDASLSALANASNTVYCECPRHLVELVTSLSTFESYSAECANRDATDAALHLDLQQTTAQARAMLEDALMRVALHEGLPLPDKRVVQR